jgi:uncharacterized protein YndB with AHSA1/START domain
MFDRQKLEAILSYRFRGVAAGELAAAVNAIMGMTEGRDSALVDDAAAVEEGGQARAASNTRTSVKVSGQIEAPLESVFDLFTDVERAAAHVSSIKAVAMLTPDRPFGTGTRWRETREVFGCLDTAEMEVTAFERYRTYTITHHKAGVRIETAFVFEPRDGSTSISIEFALQTDGLPSGFLTPLNWAIAGKVRHVLTSDLTGLKACAEKGT